jgi:uncharacterized phage protein (TIGR02218 family)
MLNLSATLISIKNQVQHRPVEIHDLYLGSQTTEDSNTVHLAHFYSPINFFTYLGHIPQQYLSLGVKRSGVKRNSKGEIERINYEIDNVNKAMGVYAAAHNFRNKRVVTRLVFRDHLDSYLDAKVVFDGFIQSIAFQPKKMTATCTPIIGSLDFTTGWPYQIQCNAHFGDSYCKINKELAANKVVGSVTGSSTLTIIDTTNLTQVDNYWNFGTITFTTGSNTGNSRKIVDFVQSTRTITIDYPFDNSVSGGDAFIVYRGCDKTLDSCIAYSNEDNYHGFHTIPLTK